MSTSLNASDHTVDHTKESMGPVRKHAEMVGNQLIDAFVLIALFVLGGTIVWSAVFSYLGLVKQGYGTIEDILLLFIYLELGAMIGIYFKSGRIPAQFLIYVAITVLTRMLASVTVVEMSEMRILVIVGAILLLCLSVLVLRFSDSKFGARETPSWLA
jgi:phosphate starvation-inducible membrane PsiE